MQVDQIESGNEYYQSVPGRIKKYVPEFNSVFDDDEVYPLVGEFGRFIIDNIKREEIALEASRFIDEALERGGEMTEDLIVLEIFQQFYVIPSLSDLLRSKLSDRAKKVFDIFKKEYFNWNKGATLKKKHFKWRKKKIKKPK